MYPGVELRLLRYAVVVAEELNFTRAAARLHVSQPSLSRQVRQLETDLGVELFCRTKRWVELTPAGRQFVKEARKALTHAERAEQLARNAHFGEREPHLIGYCPFIDLHLLSAIRKMKPVGNAKFAFRSAPYKEILAKLLAHEWEAGLVILPVSESDVTAEALLREPLAAGLPQDHVLARKRELHASDLREQPLVLAPKHFGAPFHDELIARLRAAGVPTPTIHEAASPHEALHLVSEGFGITLAQQSLLAQPREGVLLRDIKGLKMHVETGVAFHRENDSALLKSFVEAVTYTRDLYARERTGDLRISA